MQQAFNRIDGVDDQNAVIVFLRPQGFDAGENVLPVLRLAKMRRERDATGAHQSQYAGLALAHDEDASRRSRTPGGLAGALAAESAVALGGVHNAGLNVADGNQKLVIA